MNRSPDDANVRNKMVFASSKDALRRRLDGELVLPYYYHDAQQVGS